MILSVIKALHLLNTWKWSSNFINSTLQDRNNEKPSDDKYNDGRYIPSFSLGIDDEVNEDVPELNIPQEQKREKTPDSKRLDLMQDNPILI